MAELKKLAGPDGQNLQRALSLRDLPPERRAELEVIRDRVLQVRHPELGD